MFFFKKSENNWKQKAVNRREDNIKLIKREKELLKSRDDWKAKAKKYQDEILKLKEELKKNY